MKQQIHRTQTGFTLMEVMIALVIFSIGLLGLAGLQSAGMRNNQTGFYRTLAMQEANNILDRMRANINIVRTGGYALNNTAPTAAKNCISASCTPAELASWDYFEWEMKLQGILPKGHGFITQANGQKGNNSLVTITVAYDENNTLAATATANCNNAKCYVLDVEL